MNLITHRSEPGELTSLQKLRIMIMCKAFKTNDEVIADRVTKRFVSNLTEEEVDYALSLFN